MRTFCFLYLMIQVTQSCYDLKCKACPSNLLVCTECASGYFVNQSQSLFYQCQTCNSGCQTCASGTQCTNCISGFYLSGGNCFQCPAFCSICSTSSFCSQCNDGYYLNGGLCQPCTKPCFKCENQSTYCTQCIDATNQQLPSCQCSQTTQYMNQNTFHCLQCPSPCVDCISSSICSSCISGHELINQTCHQNTCQQPCLTCYQNACQTCNDSNQQLPLCNCIDSYYMDQQFNCLPCQFPCTKCQDSADFCIECKDETYSLVNSECICSDGYYMDQNQNCIECHSPCQYCQSISICDSCLPTFTLTNQNTCICQDGYFQIYDQCQECKLPCQTCQFTEIDCLTCIDINQYTNKLNQCVCNQGFYMNQNNYCSQCLPECQICETTENNCLQCRNSTYKFLNNNCYCEDGYFQDSDFNCSKCLEPCKTCTNNFDQCTSCVDDKQIILNNQCVCKDGFVFILLQCQNCSSLFLNCKKCNSTICEQCVSGYYLNESNLCLDSKCGDLILVGEEQCEDGNQNELDGCFNCKCESGWVYSQQGCQSICGDGIVVNKEQCDDQNNIQFDGCFECKYDCNEFCQTCENDVCIECQYGYNLQNNDCQSICGDGIIVQPKEECDDQNFVERDGCFNCKLEIGFICHYDNQVFLNCERCNDSKCQICSSINNKEQCQQCQTGYYIDDGQCLKCDDQCINCDKQYKNCTVFNYDVYQIKNCESVLGKYYDFKLKGCVPKCGDGIIFGQEQCDDSNVDNYDGCNSQCQIETGFLVDLNTKIPIIEPKIDSQFNKSNQNQISLSSEISYQVINCSGSYVKIDLFNETEYNYTFNETSQVCNLNLIYFKTIETVNLIHIFITYKEQYQKKRILTELQLDQEIVITPSRQVYANEQQKEQGKSMAATNKAVSSSILYFIPLAIIVGGFKFIWNILDIMSWMNNFYFLNVNYPENVRLIFQQAEWGNIISIPTLNIFNQPENDYYFESPQKFNEKGIDPLFFNNIQTVTIFLSQVIVTKLTCDFIRITLEKCYKQRIIFGSNQKVSIFSLKVRTQNQLTNSDKNEQKNNKLQNNNANQYILKIPNFLKKVHFECVQNKRQFIANLLKTLQLSQFDILLAVLLQLTNQQKSDYIIIKVNIIISYATISILFTILYLSYKVSKAHQSILDHYCYKIKYGCFYEDVKTNSNIAMFYSFVNLIRKIFFISSTVLLYDTPIYQTSLSFFSCLLNIILLVNINPFKNKVEYILNFIPDFSIFIIVGITVILAFQDKYVWFDDQKIYLLGWVIAACIYISIFLQFVFLIKQTLMSCFQNLKKLMGYQKQKDPQNQV